VSNLNIHINTEIALIGGGPSTLMAATFLVEAGLQVSIFEYKSALAKKLNIAGKSGLNLTNDKPNDTFISMYGKDADWLSTFIQNFNNEDLRLFLKEKLGLSTYIGSSGKIFPKEDISGTRFIKIWIKYLKNAGVAIYTHHQFIGWDDQDQLKVLDQNGAEITISYRKAMFAMGGISWPMTGSDGNWTSAFQERGIELIPWQASNCGIHIKGDDAFFKKWNGQFLKNVKLSINDRSVKGEIRISKYGLEGKPVYHLVPEIRKMLAIDSIVKINLDFKPNVSAEILLDKIVNSQEKSRSKVLKKLAIHPSFSMLLKIYNLQHATPQLLVGYMKSFPIEVIELGEVSKAISVVGGVKKEELNQSLMLKKVPNNYLAGEMIDWDAPTGGYLLQACFSMAKTVTDSMIEDLKF